jgi:predicted nucleic acid-binding protein
MAMFDRLLRVLADEVPAVMPPRCRDPDDQKFLELAMASGAAVLFSRDAEVLKLGRRTARQGWFQILRPEDWSGT